MTDMYNISQVRMDQEKTSLMAKLQGADHNKKGRGLEYLYLSVHDEDRDGEYLPYPVVVLQQ